MELLPTYVDIYVCFLNRWLTGFSVIQKTEGRNLVKSCCLTIVKKNPESCIIKWKIYVRLNISGCLYVNLFYF